MGSQDHVSQLFQLLALLRDSGYDFKVSDSLTLFSRSRLFRVYATKHVGSSAIELDARVVESATKVIAYATLTISAKAGSSLQELAGEYSGRLGYEVGLRAAGDRTLLTVETPTFLRLEDFVDAVRKLIAVSEEMAARLAPAA